MQAYDGRLGIIISLALALALVVALLALFTRTTSSQECYAVCPPSRGGGKVAENLGDIIKQMRQDLEWRGPGGKGMGHIVLRREEAEILLKHFERTDIPNRPSPIAAK